MGAMGLRSLFGPTRSPRLRAVELAVLLISPVLFESVTLWVALHGDSRLRHEVRAAATSRARPSRRSPFVSQHYPPLVPVLLVPLTFLPSPAILLALLAAACVPVTLWALDVRDWRCYGAAFLWPPVFSGIQTANVTLYLVLVLRLSRWRYRERAGICAGASWAGDRSKADQSAPRSWLAATGRLAPPGVASAVAACFDARPRLVVETFSSGDPPGAATGSQEWL